MMRGDTRRRVAVLLMLAACAAPRAAGAQAVGSDSKAAAQALFERAIRLADAGRYAEACPKFAESQALDPAIGTRFYYADCLERTGRVASAWTHFLRVADEARTLGQSEREGVARRRAEALRPRLPMLTIHVGAEQRSLRDLSIRRDDVVVGDAQWNTPIPVDPGRHTIVVSAPGKRPFRTTVDVAGEGASASVDVPQLQPAPVEKAEPGVLAAPPKTSKRRIIGFVIGGAGVAGIGVGSTFAIRALLKKGAWSGDCCKTDPANEAYESAARSADIATGSFIAGSVLLATGAVLVFTAPRASAPGRAGFAPQIVVGPGGIRLEGRF